MHHAQAQPAAFAGQARGEKRLHRLRQYARGHAAAVVFHGYRHIRARGQQGPVFVRAHHFHRGGGNADVANGAAKASASWAVSRPFTAPANFNGMPCIRHQIDQRRNEPRAVRDHSRYVGRHLQLELRFARGVFQQGHVGFQERRHL